MFGFEIPWHPIAIATVMMVLDIATGLAGAAKDKAINSGKMREGLWHKAGYFGLIALAAVYEIATVYINFEVAELGIGMTAPELPAVTAVCAFVVLTEVVSIVENLCVLNPDIARLPVVRTLAKRDPSLPSETVGVVIEEGEAGVGEPLPICHGSIGWTAPYAPMAHVNAGEADDEQA